MIVFVDYLYKGIGGVGQIVVNTTLELNRRKQQAKLYCSSESYEYKRLAECQAAFVFIDSEKVGLNELKNHLNPEDTIVLTNINCTPLLENVKCLNNKIVFYSVHPDTFFCYPPQMEYFCNQRKYALTFIEVLYKYKSLHFMDWPNVKSIYDRGGSHFESIKYMPVPVMSYSKQHRDKRPGDSMNITYLGRGNEEWKVFPVLKILEDLKSLGKDISLTIITDTNTLFQKMIREYIPDNKISVEYKNDLYGESLEDYLIQHSDLHISMGTSALEGAKLGVPTILIDISKQRFPEDYMYRWLYECQDYCLAGEILEGVMPYNIGRPLESVLSSISTVEGYKKESDACRQYVDKNHSIQSFVDNLGSACEQTELTSKEYCKTVFSKNMFYVKPIIIQLSNIKHSFFKRIRKCK